MYLRLACKSLLNRKGSVLLTLMAITVSVVVLLGIEHIRHQAKNNFSKTVSGVDLIVGAKTSNINLLLYSVFRIGNATNNIRWDSYKEIVSDPRVSWAIPISLGDSHRGYRVMGTTIEYFKHFSYGRQKKLDFLNGREFQEVFDVVLGFEVAKKLGYSIGDKLVLAHGLANTSFSLHDDKPFQVVGILTPTGTPVDQTLHVSLQGIEAIHLDWKHGVKKTGNTMSEKSIDNLDLTPKNITAFMVGLKSKITTFRVQRNINNYPQEPLLAILPGVALTELWQMMSVMENTLRLVSALVLIAALLGLSAMLLASMRERDREIAIMRTIGASPWFLFFLIEAEAILITVMASVLGTLTLFLSLTALEDYLISRFGLYISTNVFLESNLALIAIILISSVVIGAIPAIAAYSKALQKSHR